jgi:peptidyl-prolyl cis-trans isomerase C
VKTAVLLVLAALAIPSAGACRKVPAAEQAAAAQSPAPNAQQPAPDGQQPAPGAQPAAPAPKPMPAELPPVLARVNGQPITKFDFDRLVKNIEAGNGPIPPHRRDEILRAALDRLITYNAMKQEATARGIAISEADIDAEIAQLQKKFPNEADFKKALGERNTTIEQLKADARVDMLINRMLEAEVSTTAAATEAEGRDFYDKNPDKFKQPESVRASHILVMADEKADQATKTAARTKIDGLLKRVKSGEDFAKLAKEYSDDGSKDQGGDLGFFPRGQMVPPFDEAVFKLQPGEVSEVVTTQFGYHIIKLAERKDGSTVPFDQVKDRVVEFLSNQKKQQRAEAFIEEVKKKAKIEVLV